MDVLVFTFLSLLVSACSALDQLQTFYQKVEGYNKAANGDGHIQGAGARKSINCAMVCLETDDCIGYNYNKVERSCEIVPYVMDEMPNSVNESGWELWLKKTFVENLPVDLRPFSAKLIANSEHSFFDEATENARLIQMDLLIPGNILYVTANSLFTSDGTESTVIAGHPSEVGYQEGLREQAIFDNSRGFAQISSLQVVVSDGKNNCLRMIDRTTDSTSPFSGVCDSEESPLLSPWGVMLDKKNSSHIFATVPTTVVTVNMETGNISKFYEFSELNSVRHLTQARNGDVFVSVNHIIYKISYFSRELTLISGNSASGSADGTLLEARYNAPRELQFLTEYTLLVADMKNNILRLIDLSAENVTSIEVCQSDVPGCKPMSVLMTNDALLVGTSTTSIQKFTLPQLDEE